MSAPADDLLDPRQRQAAALLLSAIDLPAEMSAVAQQWRQAADVYPHADSSLLTGGRRAQLERARDLVVELLADIQARAPIPSEAEGR